MSSETTPIKPSGDQRIPIELKVRGPADAHVLLRLVEEFDVRATPSGEEHCIVVFAALDNYRRALSDVLKHTAVPVVIAVDGATPAQCADALERGAADVVGSPQGAELVARVRAAIGRGGGPVQRPMRIADLEFYPDRRVVRRGDVDVVLSNVETALLLAVARRKGRVVTTETLVDEVWNGERSRANLHSYVAYLRRKLDVPARRSIVHTVRGVGYALGG